jgi:CheY-like chemotaxis protein
MVSPDWIAWTRDGLERLFDLAFLLRQAEAPVARGRFRDARELQAALIRAVQQVKPSPDVPASSLAWRIYNAMDCRYLRGLTQAEAAAELCVSLRQLRREQDRGIEAVAALLFELPAAGAPGRSAPPAEEREYVRLDDLLLPVLNLLDPLLGQRNLQARLALPDPMPVVWAHRMPLRQLLIMAASALIKAASQATLSVAGQAEDDRVVVRWNVPSAAGLPPEDLVTLRELAAAARVGMEAPSPGPGGLSISFAIPASARRRILMIDDSEDAIQLTRRYLEQSPYEVIAVTRAADALFQAQALQPACILLDVMMPGHDGWEVLSLLQSHPETRRIPVIVSSVLRNQDLARALGARAVLAKPHTAEQLRRALDEATAAGE